MAYLDKFATIMRIERAKQRLTLTELSERCGVSVARLSNIENAKIENVRLTTLTKIANALGFNAIDLLGE